MPIPIRVRIPETVESAIPQRLGDLAAVKPKSTQVHDHLDPIMRGAVRDPLRRRRAINETGFAGRRVSTNPLPRATDADPRAAAAAVTRPSLIDDATDQQPPPVPTESRVTVKLHPVSSLD